MNAIPLILYGALAFVLWKMLSPVSGAVGEGLRAGVKAGQAGVEAVGGAVVRATDRSAVAVVPRAAVPIIAALINPALGLYVLVAKYFGTQTGRIELPRSDAFIIELWEQAATNRPYLSPPLHPDKYKTIEKTLAADAWNREKGYTVNLSEGAFIMAKELYTEGAGAWNPALEVSYSWFW